MVARNTAWNENVWYFALSHQLTESAPESRNLHLKFQYFFGVTPPDRTPTAGGAWRPPRSLTHPQYGQFGSAQGQATPGACWATNCDAAVQRPVF